MPPKVLAKNSDGGAKGVLPINAAARAAAATKGPAPRLKLEIRRLPPLLTQAEFEEVLGADWKLHGGKVDWSHFCPGKVSQSLGKHPIQARCYLHLVNEACIKELEARFLEVVFHDKAGSHKIPELKHLPPVLDFAPSQRTPLNAKQRTDNRQGTIDQDPEFIAFLEAETQPIVKPAALDSVGVEKEKTEKIDVKSTPLIEALREKKASKAKAAESKSDPKKEAKNPSRAENKDTAVTEKPAKEGKNQQQQKVEQASKDAAKAINKQVANKQQQAQQRPASPQQPQKKDVAPAKGKKAQAVQDAKAKNGTAQQSAAKTAPPASTAHAAQSPTSVPVVAARPPRQPRANNTEGIKKMLQKDLGIRPKPAQAAQKTGLQDATNRPSTPNASATASSKTHATPKPTAAPPTAPKAQTQQKQQAAQPALAVSTTKAYLKHANPSQGMTEILIQKALSQYGEVTNVTIDPRKGTAIALFKDNVGLKKAQEAKKVPVANGNVEVLEWRDRGAPAAPRGGFRGGRGGGRGARGGASTPVAASAAATPPPKANG